MKKTVLFIIFGFLITIILIVLSLFIYSWYAQKAYETEIENIFSKEIKLIELRSRYNNMPTFKIKEQQKILMIKTWLLSAKNPKIFNLAPYPEALDKLVIILSSNKNISINISPPDPARSKIQYKGYVKFSTPLPEIIKEVKLWNQAYENREKMWSIPIKTK